MYCGGLIEKLTIFLCIDIAICLINNAHSVMIPII